MHICLLLLSSLSLLQNETRALRCYSSDCQPDIVRSYASTTDILCSSTSLYKTKVNPLVENSENYCQSRESEHWCKVYWIKLTSFICIQTSNFQTNLDKQIISVIISNAFEKKKTCLFLYLLDRFTGWKGTIKPYPYQPHPYFFINIRSGVKKIF